MKPNWSGFKLNLDHTSTILLLLMLPSSSCKYRSDLNGLPVFFKHYSWPVSVCMLYMSSGCLCHLLLNVNYCFRDCWVIYSSSEEMVLIFTHLEYFPPAAAAWYIVGICLQQTAICMDPNTGVLKHFFSPYVPSRCTRTMRHEHSLSGIWHKKGIEPTWGGRTLFNLNLKLLPVWNMAAMLEFFLFKDAAGGSSSAAQERSSGALVESENFPSSSQLSGNGFTSCPRSPVCQPRPPVCSQGLWSGRPLGKRRTCQREKLWNDARAAAASFPESSAKVANAN